MPHPKVKNLKKVHRLVILPEFQGIGIGLKFLNEIAEIYTNQNFKFSITTSAPSLMFGLKRRKEWILTRKSRMNTNPTCSILVSSDRITVNFFYKNK